MRIAFDGQGGSQMDKRDPIVMQAIANVIGTQTMDAGCPGPQPGQTQAIYDEIKRLDRERLEAEHRRASEIQPDLKNGIDIAVVPASPITTNLIDGRNIRLTVSTRASRRHKRPQLLSYRL
jgi:hypothetical protein